MLPRPSSTSTSEGTRSSTAYPGKPCTVRPAVCDSRWRSVTRGCHAPFDGTRHEVRRSLTSSSRSSRCCATRRSAHIAATGLLMEPAWKSVSPVTGTPPSVSRTPNPPAHSIRPPEAIARPTPGMPRCAMTVSRALGAAKRRGSSRRSAAIAAMRSAARTAADVRTPVLARRVRPIGCVRRPPRAYDRGRADEERGADGDGARRAAAAAGDQLAGARGALPPADRRGQQRTQRGRAPRRRGDARGCGRGGPAAGGRRAR